MEGVVIDEGVVCRIWVSWYRVGWCSCLSYDLYDLMKLASLVLISVADSALIFIGRGFNFFKIRLTWFRRTSVLRMHLCWSPRRQRSNFGFADSRCLVALATRRYLACKYEATELVPAPVCVVCSLLASDLPLCVQWRGKQFLLVSLLSHGA